jgi:hypothetical protein
MSSELPETTIVRTTCAGGFFATYYGLMSRGKDDWKFRMASNGAGWKGDTVQTLVHEMADKARTLPDGEKLALVDQLLAQLDRPDPEIDQIWAEEARKRWTAFREGRVGSIAYADVMAKFRRP